MKYDIVFSIPIHEKFEVVIDQIINFTHFNPNCAIVFHISQGFNYEKSALTKDEFISFINEIGNVYVNPESVRTGLEDIIQAHLSNYRYISHIVDFDYYCMSASNEMFVKKGLYDYVKNYDCGYRLINVDDDNEWTTGNQAKNDIDLKKTLSTFHADTIYGSQIEGSFYKNEHYGLMADIIDRFYDYRQMDLKYAREEIYFTSIMEAMGLPNITKGDVVTYVPWGSRSLNVKLNEILCFQNSDVHYYCVKRIPRDINDCIRRYLRVNGGYITTERLYLKVGKSNNLAFLRFMEFKRESILFLQDIRKRISKKMRSIF